MVSRWQKIVRMLLLHTTFGPTKHCITFSQINVMTLSLFRNKKGKIYSHICSLKCKQISLMTNGQASFESSYGPIVFSSYRQEFPSTFSFVADLSLFKGANLSRRNLERHPERTETSAGGLSGAPVYCVLTRSYHIPDRIVLRITFDGTVRDTVPYWRSMKHRTQHFLASMH